jgi:excinuclease ABC subunit A
MRVLAGLIPLISGKEVTRHKTSDVLDYIQTLKEETRLLILSPIEPDKKQNILEKIESLGQQGFTRIRIDKDIVNIEELPKSVSKKARIELLVDRTTASKEEDNLNRLADSVESAFFEGLGTCIVEEHDTGKRREFSNKFEADGMTFEIPDVNFFTFNNPVGACKRCEGFGSIIGIDENLVVPDQRLSIYQDAVVCWKGEKMSEWKKDLIRKAAKFDFPVHKPYRDLSPTQKDDLWGGNLHFAGINAFFKFVESESYKIQYRVMLSRYRGKTTCPDCNGTRLRKDASYVKVNGKSIQELVNMPVKECLPFFENLKLSKTEQEISHRIQTEIKNRLQYLADVGLQLSHLK